jgi:hypothetical protein
MKKLLLSLALFASWVTFAQTENNKEVDAYTTYLVGKAIKIEIPTTRQIILFGVSVNNPNKGVWYLLDNKEGMFDSIQKSLTKGDTIILRGGDLPPFQTFTKKQWKAMKKKDKQVFVKLQSMKLKKVPFVTLASFERKKKGVPFSKSLIYSDPKEEPSSSKTGPPR